MVSAHCWVRAYSVRAEGMTPQTQVAYLTRTGAFAPVAYVQRTSQTTKDYGDYVTGGIQQLPAWATEDASVFFAAAKQHEGSNRYYAFQLEFSLPCELTHDQHLALRADLMEAVMPDLPALWVKHEKRLPTGELHPHIHVLFSARKQDGLVRDVAQTFHRWQREAPAQGGCEKDGFWTDWRAPEHLRHAFADVTNYHLELAQAEARVDPRSLKRRELHRKAIGRGGTCLSPETVAQEAAKAARAWDQRKAYKGLGDVTQIPREEFVLLVRQWTRDLAPGRAVPASSPEVVRAWEQAEAQRLAQARTVVQAETRILTRSLAPRRERQPGHGLQAHIFEEDRTHERVPGRRP
jgi:hypothetical protein